MSQSIRSESSVTESNIAVKNCGLRGNNIFAKHKVDLSLTQS